MVWNGAAASSVQTNSSHAADGLFASPRSGCSRRDPPSQGIKPDLHRYMIFSCVGRRETLAVLSPKCFWKRKKSYSALKIQECLLTY